LLYYKVEESMNPLGALCKLPGQADILAFKAASIQCCAKPFAFTFFDCEQRPERGASS
jgi:hypothetical protein